MSELKHESPVFWSASDELAFDGNKFALSVGQCAIKIDRCQPQLNMSHCVFENSGEKLGEGNQYIMLGQIPSEGWLTFDSCSFENMQSEGSAPAFQLGTEENEWPLLVVTLCNFSRLSCDWNGGAIHTHKTKSIRVVDCRFDSCSCKAATETGQEVRPEYGGGAIYVEFTCASAVISGCVFNNNSSPQKGQSLQVPFTNSLDGLTLHDCIFQGHQTGSVICFDFFEGNPGKPSTYTHKHTISMCQFVSNVVRATGDEASYGLVQMKSTEGIEYSKCLFQDNEQGESGSGIISVSNVASGTPYCHFIECNFSECVTSAEGETPGGILFLGASSVVGEVYVETCFVTGGPSTFIRVDGNAQGISVSGSEFDECHFALKGFIYIVGESELVEAFSVSGRNFTNCDSFASSTLFQISNGTCHSVTIDGCLFESTRGGGTVGLFNVVSSELRFVNNDVSFTEVVERAVCQFGLRDVSQDLRIEGDRFSGLGANLSWGRFVHVTEDHQQVSFVNCIFEDTVHLGGPCFSIDVENLNVFGCIFRRLSCRGNGAAIHTGGSRHLIVENCSISSCSSDAGGEGGGVASGGGGLYLEYKLKSASIEGCVFTSNKCARNNGQSIQVPFNDNVNGLVIFNCTFKSHVGPSIICFTYTKNGTNYIYDHQYDITGCVFEGNTVDSGDYGLVRMNSSVGIRYSNCAFINNVNQGSGIISVENFGNTALFLRGCLFENSEDMSISVARHVCLIKSQVALSEFRMQLCTFIGIRTESHLLGFPPSNLKSDTGILAETMEVSQCRFVNSDSNSATDSFILIRCQTFSITGNDFGVNSEMSQHSLLELHVTGKNSTVEDTAFTVLGTDYSAPLLTLSSDEGSQIEFYNCCFRHPEALSIKEGVPLFLDMTISGSAVFSSVCFDASRQDSIKQSGAGVLDIPDSSFDGCECWVLPSPEPQPTT